MAGKDRRDAGDSWGNSGNRQVRRIFRTQKKNSDWHYSFMARMVGIIVFMSRMGIERKSLKNQLIQLI